MSEYDNLNNYYLLWEQGVPGSNPGIPTTRNQGVTVNVAPFFVLVNVWFNP